MKHRKQGMTRKQLVEWLLENTTKTKSPDYVKGKCWESPLSKKAGKRGGYAQVGFHGKVHRAHRFIFFTLNPNTDSDCLVCHHCDNRACLRPSHLYAGTQQDNANDRGIRGRTAKQKGEQNSQSKLTAKQVKEIRRLYKTGLVSHRKLARHYGVARSLISRIVNYESWTHVKSREDED